MDNVNLHQFDQTKDYIQESTSAIESFITDQLKKQDVVRVALSGGSSPKAVYCRLSDSQKIDWSRVELYLVDERYTDLASKDSNYKMIVDQLISNIPKLKAFHYFDTNKSIDETIEKYERSLPNNEPLFDLVILGLGGDGHTASLFPHSPALFETEHKVVHTQTGQHAVKDRLTLTFPAILSSCKIIFLIRGKEKSEVLEKWLEGGDSVKSLPAIGVLGHPDIEIFYDQS